MSEQYTPIESDLETVDLNSTTNFSFTDDTFDYEATRLNHKQTKYIVYVKNKSGDKIGYFTFFYKNQSLIDQIEFIGVCIEEKHRGSGKGHVLLQSLSDIAVKADAEFIKTTRQRKPITCALLQGNGFTPRTKATDANSVHVGRIDMDATVGLSFPCGNKEIQFRKSRLHRSGDYIIVDDRSMLRKSMVVVLGSTYTRIT